jgi:DNA-binding transcriptional LysR family regulator
MEMHQIRYFLAVCDTLNFTRAAETCNVTQPALTRAIQKLEAELGGLLFRRERNLTHLTDLGGLMRPHLEQVLTQTETAKSTAVGFLKLDKAALNLGVMCTIGPVRFVSFLAEFRRRNPGIDVSLQEGVPSRLAELLTEGKIDIAVMAQPQTFGERFDVRRLYRERFVIAFPAGHRFQERNIVVLADVAGENYLARLNCEYLDHIRDIRESRGIPMTYGYKSEREDWIQTMIAAGMGISFMPEFSPALPGIMTRYVTDPDIVREVALVTISGRRFSPAVTVFVRELKAYKWPD